MFVKVKNKSTKPFKIIVYFLSIDLILINKIINNYDREGR